jgi:SsrA-binding protein
MSSKKKKPDNTSLIAQNKKARHDFDIIETVEGGLVLTGSEVKSLRDKKASIGECYAQFDRNGELYLINSHISQYKNAGYSQHEETRSRKVLLHRKELDKLSMKKEQQSLTLVPLKLYWKEGRVKVEIALSRGHKSHDKRQVSKDADWKRQQQRLLKNY